MLDYCELGKISDIIAQKLILANRTDNLESLLEKWELNNLINNNPVYETNKKSKIVVIGSSEVKLSVLEGVIKSLNLDKNRFEFCLDYNESKTFNYRRISYV